MIFSADVVGELALHGGSEVGNLQEDRLAIGLQCRFGDLQGIGAFAVGLDD